MNLHYFQHVEFEGLGQIQEWAESHAHTVTGTRLYRGDPFPAIEEVDLLVVMGGPMGATDDSKFPWMKAEKLFIEEIIKRQKKVLGVCLGAQLIAHVLGAKVYPNREREIGWFPIELNPPHARQTALSVLDQRSTVFHWHGDTFDLPSGALHLARSRACENQAFAIGQTVMALQFHLELSAFQIDRLMENCPADIKGEHPFVQDPREIHDLTSRFLPPLHAILGRFLDAFALVSVPSVR